MSGEVKTHADIVALISAGKQTEALAALQYCNDHFYGDGDSPLNDGEFDDACKRYTAKFGLAVKTAPNLRQARTDRQAVVPHDWPLLSGWLDKADGLDALAEWYGKTADVHGPGDSIGSPKWDGMSIVVTYSRFGDVLRVLTRGEDGFGVDVTGLLAGERHFGDSADLCADRVGIKYEVVMRWADLDAMNEALGLSMKNPRNAVAGIVNSDNPGPRRPYLTFVPLDIDWDGCEVDRLGRLEILSELFESDGPNTFTGNGSSPTPFSWYVISSWDGKGGVAGIYDGIHAWRTDPEFGYMIDGVVYEFKDDADIERLGGRTNNCPGYAIAAKFPPLTGRSVVTSIDFDLGNTGRLTPVVNYEPIPMDGRTFTRTSISNFLRFDDLRLCVGTPIEVTIRGDILGYVERAGDDPAGAAPIEFDPPEGCTFTYNEDGRRVFAYVEAALAGRAERMLVKCGVKGVKIETLGKLADAGIIASLADVWDLPNRIADMATVQGMGQSSAELVAGAIGTKLASGLWDWEILASVGIRNIGRTLSRAALGVMSLEQLIAEPSHEGEPLASSLCAALGPERGPAVLDGARSHREEILALIGKAGDGLKRMKDSKAALPAGTVLYKVVVTGDLRHWDDRDVFKEYIESLGHKMVGSVSKNCQLLITNDPSSGTVKNRKARELGIPVVTEDEAIVLMGLTAPAPKSAVETPTTAKVDLEDL